MSARFILSVIVRSVLSCHHIAFVELLPEFGILLRVPLHTILHLAHGRHDAQHRHRVAKFNRRICINTRCLSHKIRIGFHIVLRCRRPLSDNESDAVALVHIDILFQQYGSCTKAPLIVLKDTEAFSLGHICQAVPTILGVMHYVQRVLQTDAPGEPLRSLVLHCFHFHFRYRYIHP